MYAAVHDAAVVVAMAVLHIMENDEGMQMVANRVSNVTCPLHSEATPYKKGLEWQLMQRIRKVRLPTDSLMQLFMVCPINIKYHRGSCHRVDKGLT